MNRAINKDKPDRGIIISRRYNTPSFFKHTLLLLDLKKNIRREPWN